MCELILNFVMAIREPSTSVRGFVCELILNFVMAIREPSTGCEGVCV